MCKQASPGCHVAMLGHNRYMHSLCTQLCLGCHMVMLGHGRLVDSEVQAAT